MNKSQILKYYFVAFFFFPLLSQAGIFVSTGPSCNEKTIPDDSNRSIPVYCPICQNEGATKLKLKWEINDRSFTKPFCQVSCSKSDGKSCGLWHSKSEKGLLSSVNTDIRLEPIDTAYLSSEQLPHADTYTYKVICFSQEGCGDTCARTTESTPLINVTAPDCKMPCEVSFDEIAKNLKDGQVARITEKSFRDWGTMNSLDNLAESGGTGSGDIKDLKREMENLQICYENNFRPETDSRDTNYDTVLRLFDASLSNYEPIIFGFYYKDPETKKVYGHSSIAVKIDKFPQKDEFRLTFLEPNSSDLNSFLCKKTDIAQSDLTAEQLALCSFREDSGDIIDVTLGIEKGISPSLPCRGAVRDRPTEWLVSNYPNIPNFVSWETVGGVCYGWAKFVRNVACYGDFVGYDYHPNDGKHAWVDCDANHHPITKKTSFLDNPSLWLANVLEPLKNLKFR